MHNQFFAAKKSFYSLKPWVGDIIILPLAVFYIHNAGKFTFVDYVNLLIHEGGHGVFSLLGKFIYTLGGSLMQLIIPFMFIVFYWIKKKKFMTQLFLIWLGENLMNVSVYVEDARAQKLPLLGGKKVYHDWNYLLGTTGLLEYDYVIGNVIFIFGIIAFAIALLVPFFIKDYHELDLNLNI